MSLAAAMERHRITGSVKGVRIAGLLFVLVVLSSCGSSVDFDTAQSRQYLKAGRYAVAVHNGCGTTVETVVGQINGKGWSDPLLNGVTLTLPSSGDYTVVDPIGSDLMNNPPCELKLTVAL